MVCLHSTLLKSSKLMWFHTEKLVMPFSCVSIKRLNTSVTVTRNKVSNNSYLMLIKCSLTLFIKNNGF